MTDEAPEAAPEATDAQVAVAAPTLPEATEEAAPQPSAWPDNWRDRFAGTDEAQRKHLNRFASPENVYKAWRHYEKQRVDGRLKPSRPDTDDPAKLADWRKAVGLPETPDAYFQHLNGELQETDRPALGKIFARMHDIGVDPGQAKAVVSEYYRMQNEALAEMEAKDETFRSDSEEALRDEWGPEYKQNLQSVSIMMQQHGSEELFEKLQTARFADGSRMANDPQMMKFLVNLAREVVPDGFVNLTPTHGMDRGAGIADELASLEREMQDTKGRDPAGYWKNPQKQSRYAELLNAQERMQRRGR